MRKEDEFAFNAMMWGMVSKLVITVFVLSFFAKL
jgi:hypothetical protein